MVKFWVSEARLVSGRAHKLRFVSGQEHKLRFGGQNARVWASESNKYLHMDLEQQLDGAAVRGTSLRGPEVTGRGLQADDTAAT